MVQKVNWPVFSVKRLPATLPAAVGIFVTKEGREELKGERERNHFRSQLIVLPGLSTLRKWKRKSSLSIVSFSLPFE